MRWIWVCSTPCDVFTRLSVAASDRMLRPFAPPVGAKGRDVLPVDELREVMQSVCAMDLERHPEWFTG